MIIRIPYAFFILMFSTRHAMQSICHFLRESVDTTTHDAFVHELSIIFRQLFSSKLARRAPSRQLEKEKKFHRIIFIFLKTKILKANLLLGNVVLQFINFRRHSFFLRFQFVCSTFHFSKTSLVFL